MAATVQLLGCEGVVSDILSAIKKGRLGSSGRLSGSSSVVFRNRVHCLVRGEAVRFLDSRMSYGGCIRQCDSVCQIGRPMQSSLSPQPCHLSRCRSKASYSGTAFATGNWLQNKSWTTTPGRIQQEHQKAYIPCSSLLEQTACRAITRSSSSKRRKVPKLICNSSWRARRRDYERAGLGRAMGDRAVKCQMASNAAASSPSTPPQATPEVEVPGSAQMAVPEKPEAYVILSSGSFVRDVPFQRIAVWTAVALAVYELREFAGIFMGTFVLSVVGNALVAWLQQMLPTFKHSRRFIVASMYLLTVAVVVALGFVYLPGFTQEAAEIVYKVQRNEDPYRIISDRLRRVLGEKVTDQLERFLLMAVSRADTVVLDMTVTGSRQQRSQALQAVLKKYSGQLMSYFATAVRASSRFALQSVVSLILSFMVVWDFAAIQKGLQSLRKSRLSVFYEEIAPVVATFGRIFGKALQAQSAIAVVNTLLTALGILLLNIQGVGPLSVITFLCSFVPVAGVILSTVPISLVAITEGGFMKVGLVIVLVVLIHAVEAYILNPAIYSAHLKLHPILALGVIIFAEHALGVWGLLVAVPMAVFFIEYLIMRKPITIEEAPVPPRSIPA